MTTPTLTCDHCESEIDTALDPRCVVYDPSGSTDVICEGCRKAAFDRWQESVMAGDRHDQHEGVKRGWRA
jgi:hypothetical protein